MPPIGAGEEDNYGRQTPNDNFGEPIAFIGKIESMSGKWDAVAHQHIVERVLLALCDEMTKLIDHPDIAEHSMGTPMMKLSNALADYRDSRWEDR
jgi:hypothetical protein